MKTVISASRRTDIPAFYLDWFIDCVREGMVRVANPFNRTQVRQVSLSPDDVAWIVFWSRNYSHFLKKKDLFRDYELFFHFTILSGSELEKASPPPGRTLDQLKRLAGFYGGERVIWRYDPIVFWRDDGGVQSNFNLSDFDKIARIAAAAGVRRCYTSFAHPYKKFLTRFTQKFPEKQVVYPDFEKKSVLTKSMVEVLTAHGLDLYACCNDDLLRMAKVRKGHCIDGPLLNNLVPTEKVSVAAHASRDQCGCSRSIDVGDYLRQPCNFGCIYCYANPLWRERQ